MKELYYLDSKQQLNHVGTLTDESISEFLSHNGFELKKDNEEFGFITKESDASEEEWEDEDEVFGILEYAHSERENDMRKHPDKYQKKLEDDFAMAMDMLSKMFGGK